MDPTPDSATAAEPAVGPPTMPPPKQPLKPALNAPCLGCGYNLRGLADDANCPECGHAVRRSRDHWQPWADHERTAWRHGCQLVAASAACMAAVPALLFLAAILQGFALALMALLVVAEHLLQAVGAAKLAAVRAGTRTPMGTLAQRALTPAAILNACLAAAVLLFMLSTFSGSGGETHLVVVLFTMLLTVLARAVVVGALTVHIVGVRRRFGPRRGGTPIYALGVVALLVIAMQLFAVLCSAGFAAVDAFGSGSGRYQLDEEQFLFASLIAGAVGFFAVTPLGIWAAISIGLHTRLLPRAGD